MTAEQVRDGISPVPPGCTDVLCRGCVALHKDLIPCRSLNTNQEDRANSCCHGNIVCPGDIALVVTGASFTMTGEMKNSQFSFSASQPLYTNPFSPPPPLSRIHFPPLSHSTHLRQTNLRVCLPACSKKTPMQTWRSCL